MKASRLVFCLIIGVIALTTIHPARAQFVHLTLQSQPGDFIGQGGNFDITYNLANSDQFFVNTFDLMGSPAHPSEVQFVLEADVPGIDDTFALLQFGTNQLGIPLQAGFYPNAEREPFASPGHPGLDVSFQHRGSNTVTGNFTITEITFGASNVLESLSLSFEQHSEGAPPALFGTVTYSATGVPEPSTNAAMLVGAAALIVYRLIVRQRHKLS